MALVDDEDFEALSRFKWCVLRTKGAFTVVRGVKVGIGIRKIVRMHRTLIMLPSGFQVDHIDRNPLNNQKFNLRGCSIAENNRNHGLSVRNTSGFKGVSFDKERGTYKAQVGLRSGTKVIGRFKTAEEAARAYDEASKKYHSDFSCGNKDLGLLPD